MGSKLKAKFDFTGKVGKQESSERKFIIDSPCATVLHFEELYKLFYECQSLGQSQGEDSSASASAESCADCDCFIQLFKKHIQTIHCPVPVSKLPSNPNSDDSDPDPKQYLQATKILTPFDQIPAIPARRLTRMSVHSTAFKFKSKPCGDPSPEKQEETKEKPTYKFRIKLRPKDEEEKEVEEEEAGKCITPSSKRLKSDPDPNIETKDTDEPAPLPSPTEPHLLSPDVGNEIEIPISKEKDEDDPDYQDQDKEENDHIVDNSSDTESESELESPMTNKPPKRNFITHICSICKAEYPTEGQLREHFESDHPGAETKPYACSAPSCGKTFDRLKYLNTHVKFIHTHHIRIRKKQIWRPRKPGDPSRPKVKANQNNTSGKKFPCDPKFCDKTFISGRELEEHCRYDHNNEIKPYPCSICPKRFSRVAEATYHTRRHTGVKPHQCEECGKGFVDPSKLNMHKKIHMKERPCKCPHCEKRFVKNFDLRIHMRLHTGQRPYMCEFCSRDFRSTNSLLYHRKTHHGENRIECPHDECSMTFQLKSQLNNHTKIHTGARNLMCEECGMTFDALRKMGDHTKNNKCGEITHRKYK